MMMVEILLEKYFKCLRIFLLGDEIIKLNITHNKSMRARASRVDVKRG